MRKVTNALVAFVKVYLPNPFSLAIAMSILVFAFGWLGTSHSAMEMVQFWGDGLSSNLAFIMQMIMILFAGYALAISPAVTRLLKKVTSIPKTRTSALLFTFTVSYICGYINWGFGLVAAALIAKEVAAKNHGKGIDFPIMVAAAYAATQVAALSSAVPLQIAQEGHMLYEEMGVIPLSQTMFAPFNIVITIGIWAAVCVLLKFINPRQSDSLEVDINLLMAESEANRALEEENTRKGNTPAEKFDRSFILTLFVAALGFVYIGKFFLDYGFLNLSTDVVILIFLTLGILAHRTPIGYVKAVNEAIKTCAGIALMFPFYYGLMGMMRYSGVGAAMSEWFVSISTPQTFPLFTFLSAGLVNLFIPSGGGQWAVQGPVMVAAALDLGVDVAKVSMAVCWGDLWTNLLQPFWAIPVLAIAKLDVKDIMGYCAMIGIVEGIIICLAMVFL